VGDNSNFVFRQKLVGEDGSVRRDVVMVKQPGLFSPKLGTMSLHFFTQSPQNFARWLAKHGSPTIYWCFALPQLLYRWRHQSWKFWINPCSWYWEHVKFL